MRYISFFILSFVFCLPVYGLQINEIYPAPTTGNFEWVELYNNSDQDIRVSDYILTDETGKTMLFSTASASINTYFTATSSGILNNSGDTVILKKQNGDIIEQIQYPSGIDSAQSFSRCEDGTWHVGLSSFITTNPICSTPSPTPTVSTVLPQNPTIGSTPALISLENVFINEFMPNPPDGPEWVELYNDNDFDVTLIDWYIDDVENSGSSPIAFTTSIEKKGFAIVFLKSTLLNNAGDTVRLLNSAKKEIDHTTYDKSIENISNNKQENNDWCLAEPSAGFSNYPCSIPVATQKTIPPTTVPTPTSLIQNKRYNASYTDPPITLSLYASHTQLKSNKLPQVLGVSTVRYPPEVIFLGGSALLFSCMSTGLFFLYCIKKMPFPVHFTAE